MAIRKKGDYGGWWSGCERCLRFKTWGKYNCKKCSGFYTTEFKRLTHRQVRLKKRRASPTELIEVYKWLRENVMPNYVVPVNQVILKYGRTKNGWASWSSKNRKEIQIGKYYKGEELYKIMLHEMIHLQLPHHKKSFRQKQQELVKIFEEKKHPLNL